LRYSGKIIVARTYDAGLSIEIQKAASALRRKGIKIAGETYMSKKRLAPKYAKPFFDLEFSLPARRVKFDNSVIYLRIRVGLREEGAITIMLTAPFENKSVDDLIKLSLIDEGALAVAGKTIPFEDYALSLYKSVCSIIRRSIQQQEQTDKPLTESYTYIVINKTSPKCPVEQLLERKRLFAGLLRPWGGWRELSDAEIIDSTSGVVRYTKNDAVIIDWARAVLVGVAQDVEKSVITTIDMANTQRVKLRLYDAMLSAYKTELKSRKHFGLLQSLLPPSISPLPKITIMKSEISDLLRGLRLSSVWAEESYLGRVHSIASQKLGLQKLMYEVNENIRSIADDLSTIVQLRTTYWIEVLFILIVIIWMIAELLR